MCVNGGKVIGNKTSTRNILIPARIVDIVDD
jgi:hypothetical protein